MENNKEIEKKIFEAIDQKDPVLLKACLTDNQDVNIVDDNSMTPLQHAAYKGNPEIVQILLEHGADVNLCEHQHNYTALHFAGLSGNSDVCLLLLEAGAVPNVTNTVGRTPAQMAAFVAHHNCVVVINNFVAIADIESYTKGNTPLLSPLILESVHKFIMQINIHPVKVVLNLFGLPGLQEHLGDIKKVLEVMCEKEMKKGTETNEVLSFKCHYLSFIVGEIVKIQQRQAKDDQDKKFDVTEIFTRKLLKPSKDGQSYEFMDAFLKECVREFPHRECTLFRQMVTTLASEESAPALTVIVSAINGHWSFADSTSRCSTCGEEKPTKKCAKCKVVQYCDRNCQRLHWHWHKKACARIGTTSTTEASLSERKDVDVAEVSKELQGLIAH